MTDIKRCPKCRASKPFDGFYKNRTTKDGKTCYCKECHRGLNNAVPKRQRQAYNLNSLYNMTIERWDEMFSKQEGRCAICGRSPERGLTVDHNHSCCPGKRSCGSCVRDLICHQCNHAIGLLRDDPAVMRVAATYIESHLWNP